MKHTLLAVLVLLVAYTTWVFSSVALNADTVDSVSESESAVLRVVVIDAENQPILNSSVQVKLDAVDATAVEAETAANNAFLYKVTPGTYEVTTSADAYETDVQRLKLTSGQVQKLTVTLAR